MARKKSTAGGLNWLFLLLVLPLLLWIVSQKTTWFSKAAPALNGFENAIQLLNSSASIYGTSIDIPVNKNIDRWYSYWSIEGWFKPENLSGTYTNKQYLFFAPTFDAYSTYLGNGIYIANSQLYGT